MIHFLFAKISLLGDFDVHRQLWVSSPFTDQHDKQVFNFHILLDLEMLVQHSKCIPDRLGYMPRILVYSVILFFLLGSCDYSLISISCHITVASPWVPPKQRFSHYTSAKWADLR